ncbi:MAG: hypothetical protein WAW85_16565 [Gordonia sp. (in: high G+C Gram-positive bacteria)]|uniref:hypothetical protein n=1 Tax=Gordonia sp. (in: high G+C Gram-positive bacteria) TaxID=84139 RepID=UPI003BB739CB
MTAPNPYQPTWAQPQPHQQSYPQQSYPQQSYPQQSYPQQPYAQQPYLGHPQFAGQPYPSGPPVAPGPSAVTARIAAVLALLGVIHMVVLLISTLGAELPDDVAAHVDHSSFDFANTMQLIGAIVVGVLLAAGGVMLLLRNAIGRWLVSAGCMIHIIVWVLLGLWLHSFLSDAAAEAGVQLDSAFAAGTGLGWFLVLIFPLVTLVLANVTSTARWLAAAQH